MAKSKLMKAFARDMRKGAKDAAECLSAMALVATGETMPGSNMTAAEQEWLSSQAQSELMAVAAYFAGNGALDILTSGVLNAAKAHGVGTRGTFQDILARTHIVCEKRNVQSKQKLALVS